MKAWRSRALFVLFGFLLIAANLRAAGISPVEPPVPASDFTLNQLDGSPLSLSASKGRWVLLTFFATWCGPCASEMPSLERLFQARRAKGLDILAVAIESEPSDIATWVKTKHLSFPIVIDSSHAVASKYRTSGIPVSFIIDPMGNVVGVAQGARTWDGGPILNAIDDLMAGKKSSAAPNPAFNKTAEPVPLPADLIAPSATAKVNPGPLEQNAPFGVEVEVRWQGRLDMYHFEPPQLTLPASLKLLNTTASSSSGEGSSITYHYKIIGDSMGQYDIDPIELHYTPHATNEPLTLRIKGVTVILGARTYGGLVPWQWACVGATLVATSALGYGLRRRRIAQQRKAEAIREGEEKQTLSTNQFNLLQQARIAGDISRFLEIALQIETDVEHRAELTALHEAVRYAGKTPDAQTLDRFVRRYERLLLDGRR